jgi:predicted nucleic acid-binding protein
LTDVESEYHVSVKKIFTETVNENRFALNDIVLIEFFQVITNSAKVQRPWKADYTLDYLKNLIRVSVEMHYYNKLVFDNLLSGMGVYNILKYHIYDHIIYEIMKQNSVKEIVTANKKDFKKYKDISVIVPERNKVNKAAKD